jgi:Ca-activated chloride channel family protein
MRQFGFDEKALKDIAELTHARYYRAADVPSLKAVFTDIDKLEKSTVEMTQHQDYRDLFPWFLALGLAVFTSELTLSQTLWRKIP